MWHDMAKDLITFSSDSHLHGTHKYIESRVHLKIRVALNSNVLQKQVKQNNKYCLVCNFDVLDGF